MMDVLLWSIIPDGEVDHVVDLVPPDEAPEGEAFQLDDQNVGKSPQQQLLGGLAVLLALWTVPLKPESTCTPMQSKV